MHAEWLQHRHFTLAEYAPYSRETYISQQFWTRWLGVACMPFPCIHFAYSWPRLQEGRSVEVCNSFEMDYKEVDGKLKIDMGYFEVKQEQCMACAICVPPL
jgi:hypothetical protein